jgi:glyoxylase I family protein
MPTITGVSHIELTVRDAAQSAAWYERALGMRRVAEDSDGSSHVINLVHPTAGVALGLRTYDSGDGAGFSEFRVGLHHLALSVESREELDTWADHLDGCEVSHSVISEMSYGSVLIFRDPDNVQLELFVWSGRFS